MKMKINNNVMSTKSSIVNRTIAGIPLPNFDGIYAFNTKKTKTTDKEYKQMIIEQAEKDFADGKFQNNSQGFNQLMKAYVSEVSPDRQKLITEGLQKVESKQTTVMEPLSLIELLFGGELRYKKDTKVEYAEFFDENGERVAKYSNGQWHIIPTKKETARQIGLCNIYNKRWGELQRENAAHNEINMSENYTESGESEFNGGSEFDALA